MVFRNMWGGVRDACFALLLLSIRQKDPVDLFSCQVYNLLPFIHIMIKKMMIIHAFFMIETSDNSEYIKIIKKMIDKYG